MPWTSESVRCTMRPPRPEKKVANIPSQMTDKPLNDKIAWQIGDVCSTLLRKVATSTGALLCSQIYGRLHRGATWPVTESAAWQDHSASTSTPAVARLPRNRPSALVHRQQRRRLLSLHCKSRSSPCRRPTCTDLSKRECFRRQRTRWQHAGRQHSPGESIHDNNIKSSRDRPEPSPPDHQIRSADKRPTNRD